MPFVKLDCGILDSSLWSESPETIKVFLTMMALAGPDGLVEATAPGISRRALLPLEVVVGALEILGREDPHSRTMDEGGRRVVRVNGGYRLVTYEHYRAKDHGAKVRQKQYRDRKRVGFPERMRDQNGRCACCGEMFREPYSKYVVLDHDHQTGEERALVCQSCNRQVGMVENGVGSRVSKSAQVQSYLSRHARDARDGHNASRNVTQAEGEAEAENDQQPTTPLPPASPPRSPEPAVANAKPPNPLVDRPKLVAEGYELIRMLAERENLDPSEVMARGSTGDGKYSGSPKASLDQLGDDRLALTVQDLRVWERRTRLHGTADLPTELPPEPAAVAAFTPVLASMCRRVHEQAYATWIRCLRATRIVGNALVVEAPSPQALEWVEGRYRAALEAAMAEVGLGLSLELVLRGARSP